MVMSAHHCPIHVVLLPVHVAACVCLALQLGHDAHPQPAAVPTIEAAGNRLPSTVAFQQIAPWSPGLCHPEHAVDNAPVLRMRKTLAVAAESAPDAPSASESPHWLNGWAGRPLRHPWRNPPQYRSRQPRNAHTRFA